MAEVQKCFFFQMFLYKFWMDNFKKKKIDKFAKSKFWIFCPQKNSSKWKEFCLSCPESKQTFTNFFFFCNFESLLAKSLSKTCLDTQQNPDNFERKCGLLFPALFMCWSLMNPPNRSLPLCVSVINWRKAHFEETLMGFSLLEKKSYSRSHERRWHYWY